MKTMQCFMLDRNISIPTGYVERECLLVTYRLPLLSHCFILCAEQSAKKDQCERMELMAFFLIEAERLAAICVGDPQAFMLIHSGRSVRKRADWHLHVFVVQHRWQKAWVYIILGVKNLALSAYYATISVGWASAHRK